MLHCTEILKYKISKMSPLLFKTNSSQVLLADPCLTHCYKLPDTHLPENYNLPRKSILETTQIPPDMDPEDNSELSFNRDLYLVPLH